MNDVPFLIVLLLVCGGNLALALAVITRTKANWRMLGAVPILGWFLVAANAFVNVQTDPTSHNLWPLELILASVAGITLSALILSLKWVTRPARGKIPHC